MAIPTVDSGDEVRAVDHNSIVGLLNGTPDDATTAYAQPVKLNRLNDPALYSLTVGNQDTTNGLIAQFSYGTVGSATTVVSIRKRGIEARLVDSGGQVFHLEHYAPDGFTLVAATGDSAAITALEATTAQLIANDTAWTAALAAIQAVGGGVLQLPPGTLIAPSSAVVLVDNLTVAGAGMYGTVLKHRKNTSYGWVDGWGALDTFVSAGVFRNNCTFRDFAIDGDRTHNNAGVDGVVTTELGANGTNNVIARVRVFNWNHIAMTAAGVRNSIYGCRIEGPTLGSYTSFASINVSHIADYGGMYGIGQPGNTATSYNTVIDNVVYGCRVNGLTSLGDHAVIAGNVVYDNNRSGATITDLAGGGQISLGQYIVAGSSHGPRYALIAFNTIGGSTLGTFAHGIEINTELSTATVPGSDVLCIGNAISSQTALGIAVNDASVVVIANNTVRASGNTGIAVGGGTACSNFSITNNTVIDTAAGANIYGISIGAGCAVYNVSDNILANNGTAGTAHYSDLSASVNRHVWGNLVTTGTAPPNYVATAVTMAAALTVTGGQIAFPATQVPSAGANTLDDYEEGTFNFNLGGNESLAVKAGVYTKIGNLVTFNGRITVTTIGTGSTGTISGLPFSAAGAGGATIGYWATSATSYYSLTALISGSTIVIYGQTTLDGSMAAATFFQNAADIVVSGAYTV